MLAVLIKRVLAPGMESTYEEFSRKIIQAAVPAQGFISSKAFKDINDPCVRFALIQMETLADWKAWQAIPLNARHALGPIQPLMLEPESISILTTA